MKLRQTIIILTLFLAVVMLAAPVKAENFVGTHAFTVILQPGASVQAISTVDNTAYITIVPPATKASGEKTYTTQITQNFDMIFPAFENIYVVVDDKTQMASVSVEVKNFNEIDYTVYAPTFTGGGATTITSIATVTITSAIESTITKSFFVMYPAFIVSPVNVEFHEKGYFMGISLGYYTVESGKQVYVPTVPVSRNITLVWNPINQKIENVSVTAIITKVIPQVTTYMVLSDTVTVTHYPTVVETTIGMYNDAVIITKTGQGLDTSGAIISYHYGTVAQSFIVYPAILADINSFFQVVSYGNEQVAWVGKGANAVPNIVLPYTAIFLGRTYSGFMTIYFDQNGKEAIEYNATYTFTTTGDINMYMTGVMNVSLAPGQFGGVLRNPQPLTTTYVTTIYTTIVTQTTTTAVVSG